MAIKTVTIYGKEYEMEVSMLKLRKYEAEGKKIVKLVKKAKKTPNNAPDAMKKKTLDDTKETVKKVLDDILGRGAFDEIYPKTGRSANAMTLVTMDVVNYARGKKKGQYIS